MIFVYAYSQTMKVKYGLVKMSYQLEILSLATPWINHISEYFSIQFLSSLCVQESEPSLGKGIWGKLYQDQHSEERTLKAPLEGEKQAASYQLAAAIELLSVGP